jgi:DNA-binding XRE family transcriptional regulator
MVCKTFVAYFMSDMFGRDPLPQSPLAAGARRPQPRHMLTSAQIRAARGLLSWSATELARRAGVSWKTVQRAESAEGVPRTQVGTLQKIQAALEAGGVEIIPANRGNHGGGPGVRLRRG